MQSTLAAPSAEPNDYLRYPGEFAQHVHVSIPYARKIRRLGTGPEVIRLPGGKATLVSRAAVSRWIEGLASGQGVRA
jgi:hypothetical protein